MDFTHQPHRLTQTRALGNKEMQIPGGCSEEYPIKIRGSFFCHQEKKKQNKGFTRTRGVDHRVFINTQIKSTGLELELRAGCNIWYRLCSLLYSYLRLTCTFLSKWQKSNQVRLETSTVTHEKFSVQSDRRPNFIFNFFRTKPKIQRTMNASLGWFL